MSLLLPKTLLKPADVLSMSPRDRDRYMEQVILQILELNTQGATVSEIEKATGLNRATITKHLNRLLAIREAFRIQRGILSIYYRNGRVVHAKSIEHKFANDKRYSIFRLMNEEGKSIYIQEKETNSFGTVRVKGGIIIKDEDFIEFMKALQKFMLEVDQAESSQQTEN